MTQNNTTDSTKHLVTFDETANKSADLRPSDVESIESPEDIELSEYRTYGQRAECSCGEYFDTHDDGLEHLQEVDALHRENIDKKQSETEQ